MHVKKNDVVVIIRGNFRDPPEDVKAGKIAKRKILAAYPGQSRVVVEGVHLIKKAVRKSQNKPQGGFVEREGTIHASNVMLAEEYERRRAKRKGNQG